MLHILLRTFEKGENDENPCKEGRFYIFQSKFTSETSQPWVRKILNAADVADVYFRMKISAFPPSNTHFNLRSCEMHSNPRINFVLIIILHGSRELLRFINYAINIRGGKVRGVWARREGMS